VRSEIHDGLLAVAACLACRWVIWASKPEGTAWLYADGKTRRFSTSRSVSFRHGLQAPQGSREHGQGETGQENMRSEGAPCSCRCVRAQRRGETEVRGQGGSRDA